MPKHSGGHQMKKADIEKFKELLIEERNRIIEDLYVDNQEFSELDHAEVGDLVDQAYKYQEKELLINVSQNEMKTLNQIKSALKRIEEGNYGQCVVCGNDLNPNRLEALPYATECVSCKNKKSKKIKI